LGGGDCESRPARNSEMSIGLILDSLAFAGLCPHHAKFRYRDRWRAASKFLRARRVQLSRTCHVCTRDLFLYRRGLVGACLMRAISAQPTCILRTDLFLWYSLPSKQSGREKMACPRLSALCHSVSVRLTTCAAQDSFRSSSRAKTDSRHGTLSSSWLIVERFEKHISIR
jgi:hypothetical protein